jgi:hypothetical protein
LYFGMKKWGFHAISRSFWCRGTLRPHLQVNLLSIPLGHFPMRAVLAAFLIQ